MKNDLNNGPITMRLHTFIATAVVFLTIACQVKADVRTWTSTSGNHTLEAEFVKIEGDNITLRTSAGELKTLPLKNLKADDQALAQKLSKTMASKPEEPHGSSPDKETESGDEVAVTSKARFSDKGKVKDLKIDVELIGGDAGRAFKIIEVLADPIEVEGKLIEVKENALIRGKIIDRGEKSRFPDHPKNGIEVELEFEDLPRELADIPVITGKVVAAVSSGEPFVVEVEDLLTREDGPVVDPRLKEAGIEFKFKRRDGGTVGDKKLVWLTVEVKNKAIGFSGTSLIGSDGNELKPQSVGSEIHDGHVGYGIWAFPADLTEAKMGIEVRANAEKIEIPFTLKNLEAK